MRRAKGGKVGGLQGLLQKIYKVGDTIVDKNGFEYKVDDVSPDGKRIRALDENNDHFSFEHDEVTKKEGP